MAIRDRIGTMIESLGALAGGEVRGVDWYRTWADQVSPTFFFFSCSQHVENLITCWRIGPLERRSTGRDF